MTNFSDLTYTSPVKSNFADSVIPKSAPEIGRTRSDITIQNWSTPIGPTRTYSNIQLDKLTPSPLKREEKDTPRTKTSKSIVKVLFSHNHNNHISISLIPTDFETKNNKKYKEKINRFKEKIAKLRMPVKSDVSLTDKKKTNKEKFRPSRKTIYTITVIDQNNNIEIYYGKSTNEINELTQYVSKYRKGGRATKLLKAMEKAKKVIYGVLSDCIPNIEGLLEKVEYYLIRCARHKKISILNMRAGGGGKKSAQPISKEDSEQLHEKVQQIFTKVKEKKIHSFMESSPIKFKENNKKKIQVISSGESWNTLIKKNVIYDYFDTRDKKHYIGKTITTLKQRVSSNISSINKKDAQLVKWQTALKERPHDFELRIVDHVNNENLIEILEGAYIVACKNRYNGNNSRALLSTKKDTIAQDAKNNESMQETVKKIQKIFDNIKKNAYHF